MNAFDSHLKLEAKGNRKKARELSRRLHLPPGELLHVITSAGLAAVEHALTLRGGVTFPLEFEAAGKAPRDD